MAGKNEKPAASSKGGPGKPAKKPQPAAAVLVAAISPTSSVAQPATAIAALDQPTSQTTVTGEISLAPIEGEISKVSTRDQADSQEPAPATAMTGAVAVDGVITGFRAPADWAMGLTPSTGNQDQPGALAAASDVEFAPALPGAAPSYFGSSSPISIPGLAVKSSRDGFWRGGRQWTKVEQTIAFAELTDEQADAIINEPLLIVVYIDLASDAEKDE